MTAIVRRSGGNPTNAPDGGLCLALSDMGSSEATLSSAIRTETTFTVNGRRVQMELDPRESLLDVLRERLGLTGTKKGCDHGQCGACTVHLDGRRIVSCLTPAVQVNGQAVTTIEGVAAPDGTLHPLQEAFIDNDALQCGYCTPGQVMSGLACIAEGHAGDDDEIREYLSGNLCRCGAYAGILAAVRETARRTDSRVGEG
ncbi:(2Fe-2S)-binding protein [Planotetraspora silvatica]|uniref:(2Fe-2S)-binding protein n=2 Tax=Planotetraspora silvatica TaxID=234614 RepID=A0A8J3UQP5_9ACTN|nr:(2Fe-2S)-binding protein [Planotetraspora silvatica]